MALRTIRGFGKPRSHRKRDFVNKPDSHRTKAAFGAGQRGPLPVSGSASGEIPDPKIRVEPRYREPRQRALLCAVKPNNSPQLSPSPRHCEDGSYQHGDGSYQRGDGSYQYGDGSYQHGDGSCQRGDGSYQHGDGSYQRGDGSYQRGDGSYQHGDGSYQRGDGSYQRGDGSYQRGDGSYQRGDGSYQRRFYRPLQRSCSFSPDDKAAIFGFWGVRGLRVATAGCVTERRASRRRSTERAAETFSAFTGRACALCGFQSRQRDAAAPLRCFSYARRSSLSGGFPKTSASSRSPETHGATRGFYENRPL
jgi:hypothetical protein